MREIELSGSVGPGWPTPNSWERRRRRRRRRSKVNGSWRNNFIPLIRVTRDKNTIKK